MFPFKKKTTKKPECKKTSYLKGLEKEGVFIEVFLKNEIKLFGRVVNVLGDEKPDFVVGNSKALCLVTDGSYDTITAQLK